MPRPLLLLVVVLLAGGGAWLLLRPAEPRPSELDPAGERPVGLETTPPSLEGARPGATAPGRGGAEGGVAPRPGPVIDPRTLPRGPLEVHVFDVDDQPIHSDAVTVDVGAAPGQPAWFDKPLLNPDPQGHVWKGDGFLAGPVRVRVFGDHVVEETLASVVETQPTAPVVVRMRWGGSIEYHATLLDGSEPKEVRVTLLGARKQPVEAYYQVRTETVLTEPRRLPEATLGARGLIFGIPPGTYTLRLDSPATDEGDVREVVVEPRKTLALELKLTR